MASEILIVDDEADIRMLIAGILEDEGYTTREAGDSTAALEAVRSRMPSLVILDVWLQGSPLDGLEVLDQIRGEHPNLPVVVISGHGTIEMAVTAIQKGAHDFIEKPFKSDRLLLILERALETMRLRQENELLRQRAGDGEDLIGVSPATNHLRQSIEKVAPTGSRVFITGPAGSGKEVVARLLHKRSRRAKANFLALNCATLQPESMELELFGSEEDAGGKGSGGTTIGTLERAHGGTLLLDEVADMPLETQGKIVRVLQDQSFQRVGGTRRIEVDVRVMATTNRDIQAEIEAGRFREDLFYRLNVVPITLTPLSERREDIPVLAKHFLARASENAGMSLRELSEDAMAMLQAYHWPGNIRQLRNVIEWLLIMAPGQASRDPIRGDMMPPEITGEAPALLQSDWGSLVMTMPLREARERFEREYLLAQVTRFGGNISRTASFVGMERSALHRKLKSLGVTSGHDKGEKAAGQGG